MPADQKATPPAAAPPQPPADEPVLSDELRAAIDSAVQDAVRAAIADLPLAQVGAASADEGERVKRTIDHALFTYSLPGGGQANAMRGATVELSPADVERGERIGAFTARVGQLPEPSGSTLPDYDADEDATAEQDAWVKAGTIDEILKAVNERPEIAASVSAAEQRRGDGARKTLLEALAVIQARG